MRPGLVATFLLVLPAALAAQDLSQRQQDFFKSYKNLLELQDLRGIGQLVAKDMRAKESSTEGILDHYSFRFVRTGDPAHLEGVRVLAVAADEAEQGTRFTKRFERLQKMTVEERGKWLAMRIAWSNALPVFQNALVKKESVEWRRAIVALDEVASQAAACGDLEIGSLALYHIGYCRNELGEYPEVIKVFDKAMDDWLAAGRPKNDFYEFMAVRRAKLIEEGHDPEQKERPGGTGGEKRNSTTSYKEGADWQEWTTEYREMKDPNQFGSVSPWCTEHVLLWREFGWGNDGAHPLGLLAQAAPFGKPLSVVREGSKGFFDLDGDKKEGKGEAPCKVIDGKPTLNVVKSGPEKDAEGYAFFMLTGGVGQTWFRSPVIFQGSGRYRVGSYREGKILEETLVFLDDNATGSLGDPSEQHDNIWPGAPAWIDNDGIIVGKGRPIPWSDVVQIGGKWHHFKPVDPHAKKLRTRELDIQTGQVTLKWNGPVQPRMLVLAEVRDFKGSFFDVAGGKPVDVPVGRYEIAYGRIETGKGALTKQAWIFKGDSPAIEVKAGELTTVEMGAPYAFDFVTRDKGKTLLVEGKKVVVKDRTGAIVGRIYDDVPYPDVGARVKDGGALGKPVTMTRISSEAFNSDNTAAWFPADLEIKKSEKQEVEVQLTLKKPHPLLGGPFASEWK
jgi:hypothetical protein